MRKPKITCGERPRHPCLSQVMPAKATTEMSHPHHILFNMQMNGGDYIKSLSLRVIYYIAIDNSDTPLRLKLWARTVIGQAFPEPALFIGQKQLLRVIYSHQVLINPCLCTFCSPFMECSFPSHSSHTHHCLPGGLLLFQFSTNRATTKIYIRTKKNN